MDTKKYEVFEKTVELSSLTKAAEELGLTQSGVSHIIAALEEEFGFPLLTRSRTGARLTPEGEKIMPFLRDILRSQEQLDQTAAELRGLSAGTVRIATFTSVAVHWLPGMMQEFQTLYPHVEFKLFNGDYHDVDRWADGRERGHRVHHAADGDAVRMHSPAGGSASRHTAGEPSAGKEGRLPGKRGCGAAVHLAARVLGRRRAPRA